MALIVVNRNGVEHLPPCLDSIRGLDYPAERLDTIVVDNGSTDGSLELLRDRYPWARVLAQPRNLGFAQGVNVGATAASADCIALANNDMRLDPDWLSELVRLYVPEQGYTCVAGVILDWDGRRVDFVDGFVNFHGAAGQEHYGEPLERVPIEDGRQLPFACGGSMLIGREVFLELGGFDPSFFAFLEDVDLGWRLWLSGYGVRLAVRSRSVHRHHGTASSLTPYQRLFLYERNALRMLVKNVEDTSLARFLTAGLFLLIERSLLESGSQRTPFQAGGQPGRDSEVVPRTALAGLHAVSDVVADLGPLLEERARVQRRRRRSDAEVFATFGRPFYAVRDDDTYLEASARLTRAFGLDELFAARRGTRLLVVGTGRRARTAELAAAAASFVSTLYATTEESPSVAGVETSRLRGADDLEGLIAESDAVLVEAGALEAARRAREAGRPVVVDLDDTVQDELLDAGDLFLCESESERERWLEALRARRLRASEDALTVATVPTADSGDPLRPLRLFLEGPLRWEARDDEAPRLAATEDLQRLLSHWRAEYGVGRPASWHVARALWRAVPEPAQRRLRPLLRRARP